MQEIPEILKILFPVIIANVVIIVIAIFLARRLLVGDTKKAIAQINQVEADVRKREESIRREIDDNEKDLARKREEQEEAISRERDVAVKESARLKQDILDKAQKDGEEILLEARRNRDKYIEQLSSELEHKSVEYAGELLSNLFSERITEEINGLLVDELVSDIENMDASSITIEGESVVCYSSHALSDERRAMLQKILEAKFELKVPVDIEVKPELMGGLVLRLGTLELDASLRARLANLSVELKKKAIS